MADTGAFRVKPDLPEQVMGEELMVFDPETDRVHVLNKSSAFIWRCLKEGLGELDIESRLKEVYDLSSVDDVRGVIERALLQFQDRGLGERTA